MRKSPTKTNELLPLKEKPFIEPDTKRFYFRFILAVQRDSILSVICMYLQARGDIGRATLQEVGKKGKKREESWQPTRKGEEEIIGILESAGCELLLALRLCRSWKIREAEGIT